MLSKHYFSRRRIYLSLILMITGVIGIFYLSRLDKGACPFIFKPKAAELECVKKDEPALLKDALGLLKARKDAQALVLLDSVLAADADNEEALWAKAEVLRRKRDYKQSEAILHKIIDKNPKHYSSLISLAYIRYKDDKLKEALRLVNAVLKGGCLDKENQALAYMMLGTINSRRSSKGWLLSKIKYGTQIRCYFLKAEALAPDLPEVHLGLGTFYLLAPSVVGGSLDEAMKELELTVKISPDFATANARLAQACKKKGDLAKYDFYLKKAKELDPANEVVSEESGN